MRCDCIECRNNEDYYCGCPEGSVGIDENGQCNCLWLPLSEEQKSVNTVNSSQSLPTGEWIMRGGKLYCSKCGKKAGVARDREDF